MPAGKTYTPLATTTLSSAAASVTFSSISGSYTDLVLVSQVKTSNNYAGITIQFNGDTGSNYSTTHLYGNGTSALSARESNRTSGLLGSYGVSLSSEFSINKTHIMNYSNSNTYKTFITRSEGTFATEAISCLWRNTASITSVLISSTGTSIFAGSTFTLYGILAA